MTWFYVVGPRTGKVYARFRSRRRAVLWAHERSSLAVALRIEERPDTGAQKKE